MRQGAVFPIMLQKWRYAANLCLLCRGFEFPEQGQNFAEAIANRGETVAGVFVFLISAVVLDRTLRCDERIDDPR
jgi:hypothetical protein